eukprot:COSAG05_NODE_1466_length_4804_cov_1.788523_7_plen_69_part_00
MSAQHAVAAAICWGACIALLTVAQWRMRILMPMWLGQAEEAFVAEKASERRVSSPLHTHFQILETISK